MLFQFGEDLQSASAPPRRSVQALAALCVELELACQTMLVVVSGSGGFDDRCDQTLSNKGGSLAARTTTTKHTCALRPAEVSFLF